MHALLAATKLRSFATRRTSPLIDLLMATILAAGLLFVWLVGCMLFGGVAGMFFDSPNWEQLEFTTAGEPVLTLHSSAQPNVPIYHKLNGERITAPQKTLSDTTYLQPAPKEPAERFLDAWEWRIHGYRVESPLSVWYLVVDGKIDEGGYFIGFDPLSKRPIGYIGKKGFRSTKPAGDELFLTRQDLLWAGMVPIGGAHEPSQNNWDRTDGTVFLMSGQELLRVDLGSQSVSSVSLPGPPVVIGLTQDFHPTDPEDLSWHVVARLPKELVILSFEGKAIVNIPLPSEAQDDNLAIYWPSKQMKDQLILVAGEHGLYEPRTMFWIDKQGAVTRREEWTPEPAPPESWTTPFVISTIFPLPGPLSIVSIFWPLPSGEAAWQELTHQEKVARRMVEFGPAVLLLTLISLVLAVIAFRREQAQGRRRALLWFFFVLLFGWPAFVGYWLAVEHPIWARTKPALGSQPEPLPALSGIEIFA